MIWKDGQKASAKIVTGAAKDINAENWQGSVKYLHQIRYLLKIILRRILSTITSIRTIIQKTEHRYGQMK